MLDVCATITGRGRAALVPLPKSGVALRLPPHSRAALPHVRPHRTTGLKGRNIIAQGKGADRRPPPWVATHPPPWERRHSCRRVSREIHGRRRQQLLWGAGASEARHRFVCGRQRA